MVKPYCFITTWKLRTSIEQAWDAIYHSEDWPKWWKDVRSVTELIKGDERGIGSVRIYKLRSPIGYTLTFRLLLTDRIDNKLLKGNASGELMGTGAWHFEETSGVTTIQCIWNVTPTLCWMRIFDFALRRLFIYNHKVVMQRGGRQLAQKLSAQLLESSDRYEEPRY
jgi:hypothetical protein